MSDHFKSRFNTNTTPHDEGEAWLVSYADMITLLLGFFVMLYSFSKVDDDKFKSVKQALAGTFKSELKYKPNEREKTNDESVSRQERALRIIASMMNVSDLDKAMSKIEAAAVSGRVKREDIAVLSADLERMSAAGPIQPAETPDSAVDLVIPSGIAYNARMNQLTPEQIAWLRNLGATLSKMSSLVDVEIQSHQTPAAPKYRHSVSTALVLSTRAAARVAREMAKGGLPSRFIKISGMGFGRPIAAANAPGAESDNQRIHVTIRRRVAP